jgi:hypothetical protein
MLSKYNTDLLEEYFHYEPTTGEIFWWKSSGKKYLEGRLAGTINALGYVVITLKGMKLYAHKVAWILSGGSLEKGMVIDHINGVKSDNRIGNLQQITQKENLHKKRTSGKYTKGISFRKDLKSKPFTVMIRDQQGKKIHLGYFNTEKEAAEAYESKFQELYKQVQKEEN